MGIFCVNMKFISCTLFEECARYRCDICVTAVGKDEAVRGDFVGKFTTPAELSEHICVVTPESKPLVLYHMITSNSWQHVLVFVGSRKDAHRLSLLLSNLGQMSFRVAEISSSLSRLARERVLAKFSAGKIDV